MASHSQDNPHTLSTPETSNSPQPEEERLFPDIPYALPHEELNQFRRITRAYTRQIGALSLALILPRRQKISRPVVDTPDQVFVHTVEDLIDFSITKIEHPLNLIPETPADDISEPDDFSKRRSLTQNPKIWKTTMTMMKKGETHHRKINLGWPETLWPSQGESITFPTSREVTS
jgi:hypothetical protein